MMNHNTKVHLIAVIPNAPAPIAIQLHLNFTGEFLYEICYWFCMLAVAYDIIETNDNQRDIFKFLI